MRYAPAIALIFAAACLVAQAEEPAPSFKPLETNDAVFWSRQTTEAAELLRGIVEGYNASHDGLDIRLVHAGGYTDIYQKVSASIQAGVLPSMAVAYESMTTEYIRAGAVVALDRWVHDPKLGFTDAELKDFFPVVLETNTYPQAGGKMYSFPFAKSVLVMYFNRSVLSEAGIDAPPKTWEEFLAQCRQIKAKTGKAAYALDVDCSTFSAMVFSMGGKVYENGTSQFDGPASLQALTLLATLAKEGLAYQIPRGSFDDETAFAADRVAFILRTAVGKQSISLLMNGENDRWGIAPIPQADPEHPQTVLFGPNVVVFNTTQEQEDAAWGFIRYFATADVMVRWSLGTGYVPVRKSVAEDPRMQAYWARWPYNKVPFDCLEYARTEPNVTGWEEVRGLVENAETAVITGMQSPEKAAATLKSKADGIFARTRK